MLLSLIFLNVQITADVSEQYQQRVSELEQQHDIAVKKIQAGHQAQLSQQRAANDAALTQKDASVASSQAWHVSDMRALRARFNTVFNFAQDKQQEQESERLADQAADHAKQVADMQSLQADAARLSAAALAAMKRDHKQALRQQLADKDAWHASDIQALRARCTATMAYSEDKLQARMAQQLSEQAAAHAGQVADLQAQLSAENVERIAMQSHLESARAAATRLSDESAQLQLEAQQSRDELQHEVCHLVPPLLQLTASLPDCMKLTAVSASEAWPL